MAKAKLITLLYISSDDIIQSHLIQQPDRRDVCRAVLLELISSLKEYKNMLYIHVLAKPVFNSRKCNIFATQSSRKPHEDCDERQIKITLLYYNFGYEYINHI